MAKSFHLSPADAEDVIAEAVKRFWEWRHNYDGKRSVRACLYRICCHVASELVGGRLKWQKSRRQERLMPPDQLDERAACVEAQLDAVEKKCPKIAAQLREVIDGLPDIQQDIIWAYGLANTIEPDAAALGRELGQKYKDGVPIPAGTVRQYKLRAKEAIIREMKKRGYDLENLGVIK